MAKVIDTTLVLMFYVYVRSVLLASVPEILPFTDIEKTSHHVLISDHTSEATWQETASRL